MIHQMGRQAIQIAKIKETHHKLKDKWCDEQQDDMERFFTMVEELVEKAVGSTASPMAYQQLQQAKADFVKEFLETCSKYRLVETPESYRTEVWDRNSTTA